jgi:hypothetical protein
MMIEKDFYKKLVQITISTSEEVATKNIYYDSYEAVQDKKGRPSKSKSKTRRKS